MIESQNLPFESQGDFLGADNLELIRDKVKALVEEDLYTLETLLATVEQTLVQAETEPANRELAIQQRES